MLTNVFWNLVFLADVGGILALALYSLARWPWLVHRLELLFYEAGCLLILVLAVGFFVAHRIRYPKVNGYYAGGIHYGDE